MEINEKALRAAYEVAVDFESGRLFRIFGDNNKPLASMLRCAITSYESVKQDELRDEGVFALDAFKTIRSCVETYLSVNIMHGLQGQLDRVEEYLSAPNRATQQPVDCVCVNCGVMVTGEYARAVQKCDYCGHGFKPQLMRESAQLIGKSCGEAWIKYSTEVLMHRAGDKAQSANEWDRLQEAFDAGWSSRSLERESITPMRGCMKCGIIMIPEIKNCPQCNAVIPIVTGIEGGS